MPALQCEICGGKLIGKPGGIFECDSCGMEYSTEWAKAKNQEIKGTVKVEGTVEVTGKVQVEGGVKVDGPIEVKGSVSALSYIQHGWNTLKAKDFEKADSLFDQAILIDGDKAEAYLGKLAAKLEQQDLETLHSRYIDNYWDISNDINWQLAMQHADSNLKKELIGWQAERKQRLDQEEQQKQKEIKEKEAAAEKAKREIRPLQIRARNLRKWIDFSSLGQLILRRSDCSLYYYTLFQEIYNKYKILYKKPQYDQYAVLDKEIKSLPLEASGYVKFVDGNLLQKNYAQLGTDGTVKEFSRFEYKEDIITEKNVIEIVGGAKGRLFILFKDGSVGYKCVSCDPIPKSLQIVKQWKSVISIEYSNLYGVIVGITETGEVYFAKEDTHQEEPQIIPNIRLFGDLNHYNDELLASVRNKRLELMERRTQIENAKETIKGIFAERKRKALDQELNEVEQCLEKMENLISILNEER